MRSKKTKMKIKLSEISKIIENKLRTYTPQTRISKGGQVISVGDGIAIVQGLDNVAYLEKVVFENKQLGIAFTLEEKYVGVIILAEENKVKEDDRVKATGEIFDVPIGTELIGRVLDPLGNPLDAKAALKTKTQAPIEKIAPGVMTRQSVDSPLETGIFAIDALFPIGKGQRELIIGDRQTGKTTLLTDTIINQKGKDVICIYVGIGQKTSGLLEIIDKFKKHHAMQHTIIVSALASTSESLKYIAPFTGMTMAEAFLKRGKDVLIVFDDLTKHAIAYRGLSLLLNKTPGREAYPGDIFYLHSRLLERAVRLNKANGNGSITALPVVETQQQNLVAYIPTNVISITDGQIFLMSDLFNAGFKPAIDYGLSVSRVGSAAQIGKIKRLVGSLKLDLAQYKEFALFARFGGNLDRSTQAILDHGQRVQEFLKQPEAQPLTHSLMAVFLFVIRERLFKDLPLDRIAAFRQALIDHFTRLTVRVWKTFVQTPDWDPKQEQFLTTEILKVKTGLQASLKTAIPPLKSSDETKQKSPRAKN